MGATRTNPRRIPAWCSLRRALAISAGVQGANWRRVASIGITLDGCGRSTGTVSPCRHWVMRANSIAHADSWTLLGRVANLATVV